MNVLLENVSPAVFGKAPPRPLTAAQLDDNVVDPLDAREIFDLICDIQDPEHPISLEELNVINEEHIEVSADGAHVDVQFTPTIPHCSMATLIGLAIRVKLLRSLPSWIKVRVRIKDGTHAARPQSELSSEQHGSVNKQLADKERVAAALENPNLLEVVNRCLEPRQ